MRNKSRLTQHVNLETTKDEALTDLEESYMTGLDDTIDLLVWAVRDKDHKKIFGWASVLSCKYGIEMEEVLNKTELNQAIAAFMN